jgi:hypothetical protein
MIMSYALHNYSPYEGFKVALVGTRGRIELDVIDNPYISGADGKLSVQRGVGGVKLRLFPLFQPRADVPYEQPVGGHGGGDSRLLRDVFLREKQPVDPLGTAAGPLDGAYSILVGIAARRSIETGAPVRVSDLVRIGD